jgi:uncharacterized membrane protein
MESTPEDRRRAVVAAILAARRDDGRAVIVAEATGDRVVYEDRRLRLMVDDVRRSRLDELLEDYRVFKIQQPATRKADDGVVSLSAVTDPKHAADFVEALFREVYDADEGFDLRVE